MSFGYPHFTNLAIAVPLTGRPLVPAFAWLGPLALHPPMNSNVIYMSNFNERHVPMPGPVADLRNWYGEQAIAHNCAYLFYLDEDVTVPAHALRQLMYMMEHYPDAAAIGGVVPHKGDPQSPMVFRGNGNGPYWDWHAGEFFEVSGIGMGCTLIRVDALRAIDRPWFKTVDKMDAFLDGIPKAEVWTEDLYFCDKAIKTGRKIYADTSILCTHWDLATGKPYTLPPSSKPMLRKVSPPGKPKIVDLGCGESPYQTDEGEVVTVDIRDEVKPDYRADLRRLPFASKEFSICFSSHVLEHFSRADVPEVLDEWCRILRDDGELRLILPDIEWAAHLIANGTVNEDVLNVVLGAQNFNGKDSPWNYHKFCFTPKILTDLLKARGFKRIDLATQYYNLYCRAWRKPPKQAKPAPGWPQEYRQPHAASAAVIEQAPVITKRRNPTPEVSSHPGRKSAGNAQTPGRRKRRSRTATRPKQAPAARE